MAAQEGPRRASQARRTRRDQGAIDVLVEGGVGALVELTAETDFVAKGADFTGTVAGARRASPLEEGKDELAELAFEGETVGEHVTQLAAKLGENVALGRVVVFETADGVLDGYKHIQNDRGHDRRARRARRRRPGRTTRPQEVAHDLALHIASAAPRYLTREDVPADVVEQGARTSSRSSPATRASPRTRSPRSSRAA